MPLFLGSFSPVWLIEWMSSVKPVRASFAAKYIIHISLDQISTKEGWEYYREGDASYEMGKGTTLRNISCLKISHKHIVHRMGM
jgi:hypothetical protein